MPRGYGGRNAGEDKEKNKKFSGAEQIDKMNKEGLEQVMPGTDRVLKIRTLDTPALLRSGKVPDILTPLVVKSIYQDLSDRELRDFLGQKHSNPQDALAMLDAVDYVVEKSVVSGAKVQDLTLAEKRWIFRLAMGPAELLITFRFDSEPDVESVAEGDEVREATE
jgi:hypothetical protein